MQDAESGHERPHQQAGGEPHAGHDGADQDGQRPPLLLQVAAGQLHTRQHQLHAEHQPREVERDGIEVLLRAGVVQRPDEVRRRGRERDAGQEGDDFGSRTSAHVLC